MVLHNCSEAEHKGISHTWIFYYVLVDVFLASSDEVCSPHLKH